MEDWQLIASKSPPKWFGDLNDDCTAHWAGLMLRAEMMDQLDWWWCVYDDAMNEQIASSNEYDEECHSGEQARLAAERAA